MAEGDALNEETVSLDRPRTLAELHVPSLRWYLDGQFEDCIENPGIWPENDLRCLLAFEVLWDWGCLRPNMLLFRRTRNRIFTFCRENADLCGSLGSFRLMCMADPSGASYGPDREELMRMTAEVVYRKKRAGVWYGDLYDQIDASFGPNPGTSVERKASRLRRGERWESVLGPPDNWLSNYREALLWLSDAAESTDVVTRGELTRQIMERHPSSLRVRRAYHFGHPFQRVPISKLSLPWRYVKTPSDRVGDLFNRLRKGMP